MRPPPVLTNNDAVRVGFSTPKRFNPISWIVRKMTGSKCSHAWFLYYDKDFEMQMVMEAHEIGFRLLPFDHFKKKNSIVNLFVPRVPIDVGLKVVAQRYLDTHYDYAGLIGMAIVALGKIFKKAWKNPFRSTTHVFCSEAMAIAMKESPGYEKLAIDTDAIEPEELRQYFEKDGAISVAVE